MGASDGRPGEGQGYGHCWEQNSVHLDSGLEPFLHTPSTAPVSTGPWCVHAMSAQSLGLGQPGAAAQLPVVGAPPSAVGAARRVPGGHHARPRTQSNGRSVTRSPAPSAHLARCSATVPPRARASAHICSLVTSVCRSPANLAVAALEGRWVRSLGPDSHMGEQAGVGVRGGGPSVTGACAVPAAAQWLVCAPCRVPLHPDLSALGPHPDP
ncbi:hypothetical protein HPG69_016346 [Diceros bicornis minor]|uniref:Uncharacterized protein n=1 Tax=Diceros bicornis minor TaxID=77932 RepID=A0A7J7ETG7_DICBM|nr:hypothetical protein HPG69_016346 [Diceros bicornis minor]